MKRNPFTRRKFIRTTALALPTVVAGCRSITGVTVGDGDFVTIRNRRFERRGRRYCFLGTNFPHAATLADPAWPGGRGRLVRELDRLHSLGVTNLRLLAGSEGSRGAGDGGRGILMRPGQWDEGLLEGLDFALAEMAKRDMTAVLYLTNYWEWSGGMAQYVSWATGEPIPEPDPAGGRRVGAARMTFAARFYGLPRAQQFFRAHIIHLLNRRNTVNGRIYRQDPAIMSWQLANEPRPGTDDPATEANLAAFCEWMDETARLIKAHAPGQLVSTGSEGIIGCIGRADVFLQAHQCQAVDYTTLHLWVKNWGWLKETRLGPQYERAAARALRHVARHVALAEQLGKPLAMEEFGIGRDNDSTDPKSPTAMRDDYYAKLFHCLLESCQAGGPLQGANFWLWSGEGNLSAHRERERGNSRLGEPIDYNGVLQTDWSTLSVIRRHSLLLSRLEG